MAKAKRKLLPKDFEEQLRRADLDALKGVFDTCLVDARGGYSKRTTLAFNECPDELARWLVAQGAGIDCPDSYGETPLHARCSHWQGRIAVLLELGADIHRTSDRGDTALHKAANVGNAGNVKLLLDHGAAPDARNAAGLTPLSSALQSCQNTKIAEIAEVAEVLLAARAQSVAAKPSRLARLFGRRVASDDGELAANKQAVQRIGAEFEFHRQAFNPESVDRVSAGLDKLYLLFDVPPVPRRVIHDGKGSIIAKAADWETAHHELWAQLVPSSGAANTVQGEVIRISGRIDDELYRNGGANWDADYRDMANALIQHLGSGNPLDPAELAEASRIVKHIRNESEGTRTLCRLAVKWVALNPAPLALSKPAYRR